MSLLANEHKVAGRMSQQQINTNHIYDVSSKIRVKQRNIREKLAVQT